MQKELDFLCLAEKLKLEMRHSWLSDGKRQESVAEHSWRLALMALRYASQLDQQVNVEKCLKLALIHDLAEAITGDIPVFQHQTNLAQQNKFENEYSAMKQIQTMLNDQNGDELLDLWLEFENQTSYESKFIKALDKLEVFIQHNEAPLTTWEEREKRMLFQKKWLIRHCEFDSFLNALCLSVIAQGVEKLKNAGDNIAEIIQSAKDEEKNFSIV